MQTIKFYKKYDTHLAKLKAEQPQVGTGMNTWFLKKLEINDVEYKGYNVGDLPNSFGFIYNKSRDQEGRSNWFNYKGLTYIEVTELPW